MAIVASALITLASVTDVKSVTRYYILRSSTQSSPTSTTNTISPVISNWSTSEPTYTEGSTNSLYFVDKTTFSDDTYAYSAVSLSSSYEAAKVAYNKAKTAQDAADKALSNTEVIVGTQTAVTGAWTGVASFSELTDGQQIVYWLPYGGSGNATLNLTLSDGDTTGAIACYYGGTTRLTTHYAAGNAIHLTYRVNAQIGSSTYTGWWADANYNADTYDRVRLNNAITAKTAITAKYLIVGDASGYYHLGASVSFDVTKPILYAGSIIAAGSTGSNNYLSYPSITLRTFLGSSWTTTSGQTLYLAGTLNGSTFTAGASNWLTTDASDENVVYISIGYMYSTYQMYLYPEHPIYRIYGGVLKNVSQMAYDAQILADTAGEAATIAGGTAVEAKEIADALDSDVREWYTFGATKLTIGKSDSSYVNEIDNESYRILKKDDSVSEEVFRVKRKQVTAQEIRIASPADDSSARIILKVASDGGLCFVSEVG